ncbi:hypothetical protein GPL15_11335 [Clostridium sp. MCC353]|uniref:hypothetical protein n=1 Tax=Clostridium sp. MCC353 TaxID=2592646 RepID=UPI001C01ECBB|nr:hypothetical protein [Clostridium sp. MCC353]MBT9777094.1 hypothetical protein [Clostridium sp. MCC353]
MITPLKKNALHNLLNKPILFDANIFMVGISDRTSDKNCSFENMKRLYIKPLFESFTDIYIHEEVYKELDGDSRTFLNEYKGKNVTVVSEGDLYDKDPKYITIFNSIANHELVRYERGRSKDRGEVYSLAYAAYYNMNYFCSKEIMVDNVARELEALENVDIITFDIILLQAYVYYALQNDKSNSKGLKSIYKKYCADVIRRHNLPATFSEYIKSSLDYL